jgi:hypothetical protein
VKQKDIYSDKIVLIRVGEVIKIQLDMSDLYLIVAKFYETFGIDAIMLVQYAGLNPMGGRARAGCPVKNIQPVLNSLTSAGFTVAVYEEINDIDIGGSSDGKSPQKVRRGRPAAHNANIFLIFNCTM